MGARVDVNHEEWVSFDRSEREVAKFLSEGRDPKEIAATIEVALSTAYDQIKGMCKKAQVVGRATLLIWILQHPACLFAGVASCPGLHVQPCDCGSPYCLGMIAAQLPPRTNLELGETERVEICAALGRVAIDTVGFGEALLELAARFPVAA